jgi:transposase
MGKLIERCAGIDIGKRFLVCCVMTGAAHEEPRTETRRFDTTVPVLKRLRNWLNEERVTDVVMESTGSYWIPVFNLLEGYVRVVLANPEEVKNRKGHKTDRKDAEHLAGVYWEWSKKKRKFVILCGVTGTILYYPRPLQ